VDTNVPGVSVPAVWERGVVEAAQAAQAAALQQLLDDMVHTQWARQWAVDGEVPRGWALRFTGYIVLLRPQAILGALQEVDPQRGLPVGLEFERPHEYLKAAPSVVLKDAKFARFVAQSTFGCKSNMNTVTLGPYHDQAKG
jgi:hypothetical protein